MRSAQLENDGSKDTVTRIAMPFRGRKPGQRCLCRLFARNEGAEMRAPVASSFVTMDWVQLTLIVVLSNWAGAL